MPTPTSMAAATDGPEAVSTVQMAYCTMSSASASFMVVGLPPFLESLLGNLHARPDGDFRAAFENRDDAVRDQLDLGDLACGLAVGRGNGAADDRGCLLQ